MSTRELNFHLTSTEVYENKNSAPVDSNKARETDKKVRPGSEIGDETGEERVSFRSVRTVRKSERGAEESRGTQKSATEIREEQVNRRQNGTAFLVTLGVLCRDAFPFFYMAGIPRRPTPCHTVSGPVWRTQEEGHYRSS